MKQVEKVDEAIESEKSVLELRGEQKHLLTQYKEAKNKTVKRLLEEDIDALDKRIDSATDVRNKNEVTERQIAEYIKRARYMMEHPSLILLSASNQRLLKKYWGFLFEELPTYQEIVDGTPKLQIVFEFAEEKPKQDIEELSVLLVGQRGLEPRTSGLRGRCSTN